MTKQLDTGMSEFQQRVIDNLRGEIRELMTPETLKVLVERAVDAEFFKDKRIPMGYGNERIERSFFVHEVAKLAEPYIREQAQKFVDERKDVIDRAIQEFLTDKALTLLIVERLGGVLRDQMDEFFQRMDSRR